MDIAQDFRIWMVVFKINKQYSRRKPAFKRYWDSQMHRKGAPMIYLTKGDTVL